MGRTSFGKYRRWVQPIRNRLPAYPSIIETGRKVKLPMFTRVTNLVKGGVIPKPLWYDAMRAHMPPLKLQKDAKPMRLEWEEDRLRKVWLKRNPSGTMEPKALFIDPSHPEANHEHPADAFVNQQIKYMRKGYTEEEAYRLVLQKQREEQESHPPPPTASLSPLPSDSTQRRTGQAPTPLPLPRPLRSIMRA